MALGSNFGGSIINGYDTGNRLEAYSKNLNVNRHLADIALDILKRSERLTQQTINAFTSSPQRFDANMAAISDIITDPKTTPAERKRYLKLRETIVQNIIPGLGAISKTEKDAIDRVSRNTKRITSHLSVSFTQVEKGSPYRYAKMPTLRDFAEISRQSHQQDAIDDILVRATQYKGFDFQVKTATGRQLESGLMSGYVPAGVSAPMVKANKRLRELPLTKMLKAMGEEIDLAFNSDEDIQLESRIQKLYYRTTGIDPKRVDAKNEISRMMQFKKRIPLLKKDADYDPGKFRWVALSDEDAARLGSVFTKDEREALVVRYDPEILKRGRERIRQASPGLLEREYDLGQIRDPDVFSHNAALAESPGEIGAIEAKINDYERSMSRYQLLITSGNEKDAAKELIRLNQISAEVMSEPEGLLRLGTSSAGFLANGRRDKIPALLNPATIIAQTDPDNYRKLSRLGIVSDFEKTHRNQFEFNNTEIVTDVLGDRDLELFKTPGAQSVARAYTHMRTLRDEASGDKATRTVIDKAMTVLAKRYSGLTKLDSTSKATKILSRTSEAAVKQSMAHEATSLWADMANQLYGGVVMNDAGNAFWNIQDRSLIGQRGFVTGVHASAGGNTSVTVAVKGLLGSDDASTWISMERMLELTKKARLKATSAEVAASARSLGGVSSMVQNDKDLAIMVARMTAKDNMDDIGRFFTMYAENTGDSGNLVPIRGSISKGNDKIMEFKKLLMIAQNTDEYAGQSTVEARAAYLVAFFLDRKKGAAGLSDMMDMISEYVSAFKTTSTGKSVIVRAKIDMSTAAAADITDLAGKLVLKNEEARLPIGDSLPEIEKLFERIGDPSYKGPVTIKMAWQKMWRADVEEGEAVFKQMLNQMMGTVGYDESKVIKVADVINSLDIDTEAGRSGSALDYVISQVSRKLEDIGGRHLSNMMGDSTRSGRTAQELQRTYYGIVEDTITKFNTQKGFHSAAADIVREARTEGKTYTDIHRLLMRAGFTDEAEEFIGAPETVFRMDVGENERFGKLTQEIDYISGRPIEGDSVATESIHDSSNDRYARDVAGRVDDYDIEDARRADGGLGSTRSLDEAYGEMLGDHGDHVKVLDRNLQRELERGQRILKTSVGDMGPAERTKLFEATRILGIQDQDIIDAINSGDREMQNRAKNYVIKSMHEAMTSNNFGANEQREMSRLMAGVIGVEGMEDITWKPMRTMATDGTMQFTEYMIASGVKTGTTSTIARAWHIGETARLLTAAEASDLIRFETVSSQSVGRASGVSYQSAEMMNAVLAKNGFADREQMEVMRRLMPDLHADATSKEVLQAIAATNRQGGELPVGWNMRMGDIVDAQGALADKQTMDPFEFFAEVMQQGKNGDRYGDNTVDALRPAVFHINDVIENMRLDPTDPMFRVAENAREAVGLDPFKGARKLMRMSERAPRLAKVAVGMIAIGGIAAAYRALETGENRTEEFLQYDHPGSAGINRAPTDSFSSPTRLSVNTGGYSNPANGRSTPSPAGMVTVNSQFKGYRGTISISDNMDSMPTGKVADMMGGI